MDQDRTELARFELFYRRYHGPVHRLAMRLFGPDEADDVTQEVMLRALRRHAVFDEHRPAWPWLATVTRNVGIDLVRARRHVPAEREELDELIEPAPDVPALEAERADMRRSLSRALRELSTMEAEVIRLHELYDVPLTQIAARTGTTPNAMRQRLFRARQHLGQHLERLGAHRPGGPGGSGGSGPPARPHPVPVPDPPPAVRALGTAWGR